MFAAVPLATAVGLVPAGLGVREAVAVGLGVLTGLGGATAGVAAGIDRIVGMVMLLPAWVAATWLQRRGRTS